MFPLIKATATGYLSSRLFSETHVLNLRSDIRAQRSWLRKRRRAHFQHTARTHLRTSHNCPSHSADLRAELRSLRHRPARERIFCIMESDALQRNPSSLTPVKVKLTVTPPTAQPRRHRAQAFPDPRSSGEAPRRCGLPTYLAFSAQVPGGVKSKVRIAPHSPQDKAADAIVSRGFAFLLPLEAFLCVSDRVSGTLLESVPTHSLF